VFLKIQKNPDHYSFRFGILYLRGRFRNEVFRIGEFRKKELRKGLPLILPIFHERFLGVWIGIYLFYENWSTETFRKSKKMGCLFHLQSVRMISYQMLTVKD